MPRWMLMMMMGCANPTAPVALDHARDTGVEMAQAADYTGSVELHEQWDTYSDTGPPYMGRGPRLHLRTGSCPGPMRFSVVLVRRNARLAYLLSPRPGQVRVPAGPCRGLPSGLGNPVSLLEFQTAPYGFISTVRNVPQSMCGQYLQVVDLDRCRVTSLYRL